MSRQPKRWISVTAPATVPLAHRHMGDHLVKQVRCRLRHAPRTAEGQNPLSLQLKATSLFWPQSESRQKLIP